MTGDLAHLQLSEQFDLGTYRDKEFALDIDHTVSPKFCKTRTVPCALREKVNLELDSLQKVGIITPVTNSPWVAAIVPVLKSDGSVRNCGDYKLTVNKAIRVDTYSIPSIQDLFSNLAGGSIFSKLDRVKHIDRVKHMHSCV